MGAPQEKVKSLELPQLVEDIDTEIDTVWNLINKYNLNLKLRDLRTQRAEFVRKVTTADEAIFVKMSEHLVQDMSSDTEDELLQNLWPTVLLCYQPEFETAEVHTAVVAFKVDDDRSAQQAANFMRSKNKLPNGQVGAFGQGNNPGEAFRNAINALHAEFFGSYEQ